MVHSWSQLTGSVIRYHVGVSWEGGVEGDEVVKEVQTQGQEDWLELVEGDYLQASKVLAVLMVVVEG